ncbi:hypothetical protein QR680_014045 [Steinernema hermaphroditum]|uniref:Uncharacterized protein n=1 Tax=Steinernema hermaphroditum TaxID=289476 RepID=A0AA39IA95_9BILA|nr:hypothetical protein QR680_014045 [Steinernema hermaphroditum]
MRLFDLCFHAFLEAEAGIYEHYQAVLPNSIVRAFKRREQSRKEFSQLYETKLDVAIPNRYVRYHRSGEVDFDETLKAATAKVEAQDVFKMMMATNAREHADKIWDLIPRAIKCCMTADTQFHIVRNEVIQRLFKDPLLAQTEAAYLQCLQYGWIDAALQTYKSMRPEHKTSHLAKAWFTFFFKANPEDGDLLRRLLDVKDFEMRRPSIDLSFFFSGYTFEDLLERRKGSTVPDEFQVREIEEWIETWITSPTGDVPIALP